MKYDQIVNKLLQEAYFSSPYEKQTGIKRHVGIALEADKHTQNRKMEKIEAAAEIVNGVLDDHFSQENAATPNNKEFVKLAIGALGSTNFDDKAYQRAFDEPGMEVTPDDMTLADFRKYKALVDQGARRWTEKFKMISPERVRVLTNNVKKWTQDMVARAESQVDGEEDSPVDVETLENQPVAEPKITDYATELLRRKGLA
jgi:hypothetical protein